MVDRHEIWKGLREGRGCRSYLKIFIYLFIFIRFRNIDKKTFDAIHIYSNCFRCNSRRRMSSADCQVADNATAISTSVCIRCPT